MGLINIASGSSVWRGLDYYNHQRVISYKQVSDSEYESIVLGSNHEKYHVFMDVSHPRKSTCDCPHANGNRIICKHIVVLYFTVFPSEVDSFLKEVEEAEREYEAYEKERVNKLHSYIYGMSKQELQETVFELLDDLPEWAYDRFIRDKVGM